MALVAAPLSAPAEEPWLHAVAGCGLPFALLIATDASRAGLERGLEDLCVVAELSRCVWVARLAGAAEDLGFALSVAGAGAGGARAGGVVVVQLGPGAGAAAAVLVDGCGGGARHSVMAVQVDEARAAAVAALLSSGDLAAAVRGARLAVLRDARRSWAVVARGAGASDLLRRVTAPGVPVAGLPVAPVAATAEGLLARALARLRTAKPLAALGVRMRGRPRRLGAAVGSLLVAALAMGGAGWEVAHRAASQIDPSVAQLGGGGALGAVPVPRVGAMSATWDRTAQVVLFGGATALGSGHGAPLDDTWRGALPPAAAWQRATAGSPQPSARLAGAMAADVTDGYVLLFGGEAAGDIGLDDTWTYAGGWAQLAPRQAPPAGPALAATEPSTGHVLLVTTCCALAAVPTGERMQTWRWTGGDWSLLGPAPGWVSSAALVADPWDGTVVMVADGGGGHAATFVWNGSAWSRAGGAGFPPVVPGVRPALAYDPGSHAVLDVVVGDDGVHHTWSFTSAHGWAEASDAGGPAVVGLLVHDPVDGRAVLYGGASTGAALTQRWFWTGSVWTQSLQALASRAVPAAGFGSAVAADPRSEGLVLFGGAEATDQTWVWSGLSWSRQVVTGRMPPPRAGASMAYDPLRRATVLVGGRLADGSNAGDMWEWRDGAWSRLSVGGVPPPSVNGPMAWDWPRQQMVLLVPDGSQLLPTAQTWTWDGLVWSQRHPALSAPLRSGASMTWDPATGEVLLTVPCCPGAFEQRTETWTWDGASWSRRQTLHSPPIPALVAEDDIHARTVLMAACCGGFDPASTIGPPQTWVWDGSDWTRTSAALPALQDVAALATDLQGHTTLIARVAGAGPRHPLDGLWRWSGSAWVRLV